MANKEQRGSREKRKPKKEKPRPMPHASSFSGTTAESVTGKKAQGLAAPCPLLSRHSRSLCG